MKSLWIILALVCVMLLAGCGGEKTPQAENPLPQEGNPPAAYVSISQEEAKNLMDTETGYIILDVRRQDEFDAGHIPGAVLLPNEEVAKKAESVLTDKHQLILVYCRSGNRSKQASQKLANLGYTNVKEFGGILDWPYGTVTE